MKLNELKEGESAVITSVLGGGATRQHLFDMGVVPGVEIQMVKKAPMGDPIEYQLRGYELTLRIGEAEEIEIKEVSPEKTEIKKSNRVYETAHPGLGEGGRFHKKGDGDELPSGTTLTYALVGNQNCGKTTLFNQLTGSNQHVGNFPGVTVDRKDGVIKKHADTLVTDLPGIYSMSPYSSEEIVSRDFVLKEKPKAIINIIDGTNIERNLYLTMQLLEMDVPMVVALNFMDEVLNNNGSVDVNRMEEYLGIPVIPISAAKNEGVSELVDHAIHIAKYQEHPRKQDFCSKDEHGGAIHRAIHAVEAVVEDHAERAGLPIRFSATKIIEGDPLMTKELKLDQNELETIEHIVLQMEKECGMDRNAAIADMRFDFIEHVAAESVKKPKQSKERTRSEKIDKILTGKWTAIPCFILIMAAIFYLTFNVIGAFLQDLLALGIEALSNLVDAWMTSANVSEVLHSLVIDGIFEGVGSVLSFLPIVVVMFFFLSILEDSGYIARVAFFMDKLLRKLGLSGRSIVPLLIGFGCTVPAVMSTRTLPSHRDRHMTILLTPFMSCSAKLPIYAFFVNAFFPGKGGFIMVGLYVLSIVVGILIALIFKKTLFKGEAVPFVMELPNYRFPGARNVGQLLWEKAKDFLSRAFTIILLATIVIWFLQSFDAQFCFISDSENSLMAHIAGWITPVFEPLGLGDWRIVTSLISGFLAKESVVATMGVLFGENISAILTTLSAITMLVFSLLYTPCIAAIASIRRELGHRWAIFVVIFQCVVAWVVAFIVRLICLGIGM